MMPDEAPTKFPILNEGSVSFSALDKDTRDRFLRNEVLVYSVLVIVAVTLVTVLIGAATLVLDQLHFNNELYRDNSYNHTKTTQTTNTQALEPVTFPNLKPN